MSFVFYHSLGKDLSFSSRLGWSGILVHAMHHVVPTIKDLRIFLFLLQRSNLKDYMRYVQYEYIL